jgi:hypothetical protein
MVRLARVPFLTPLPRSVEVVVVLALLVLTVLVEAVAEDQMLHRVLVEQELTVTMAVITL